MAVKPPGYTPLYDQDILSLGYSRRTSYFLPKEVLQNYSAGASDVVRKAAIDNNTTAVANALKSNKKSIVVLDPTDIWPINLEALGQDSSIFAQQIPIRLQGKVKQAIGSFPTQAAYDSWKTNGTNPNNYLPAKPCVNIERAWATASDISSLSTIVFGPQSNVPWYDAAQSATKAVLTNASELANYNQGDQVAIRSQDFYAASTEAGYSDNCWKQQMVSVNGIGVDVANYTLTAVSSANVSAGRAAVNQTYPNNGMETRVVRNNAGTVKAVCMGDTANGTLIFAGLTGPFAANETLYDDLTGQSFGTVSSQYVIINGKMGSTYATSPCIMKVDTTLPVYLDLEVSADGDVDAIIGEWNRCPEVVVSGVYDIAGQVKILSGTQRGMTLTSCKRGKLYAKVSGLPNHALETELRQGAYGYGVTTFGCSEDLDIELDVKNVRHGYSSNLLGGKLNMNSSGNVGTNQTATNYVKYGTTRNVRVWGRVEATFGAGLDTHEASVGVTFENFRVIKPFAAGRILTAGVGVNTRGFNTIIRFGYIEDCLDGIFDSSHSVTRDSGQRSDTRIYQVIVNGCDRYGYAMNNNTKDLASGETYVESCTFRGNTDISTTQYFQAGIMCYNGQVKTRNNVIESMNGCHILHKGDSNADKTGGLGVHVGNIHDFTDGTANTVYRYEAQMLTAAVIDPIILAGGASRPASIFRHESGAPTGSGQAATKVQYSGVNLIQTTTTPATPTLLVNNVGSVATISRVADIGQGLVPAGGTTGQVLYSKSAADYDVGWMTPAAASGPNVQQFTASGTWTKPSSGTLARVICVGGGHGGGGGGRNASGTAVGGGGGGSTASVVSNQYLLTDLGATETVTVGAGGAGGAGATANGGTGSAGTQGGTTQFGTRLRAAGGNPGNGGGTAAGTGGTAQNNATNQSPSFSGAAGGLSAVGAAASGISGGAGSGGGGGGASTTAAFAGGVGTTPGYAGTTVAGGANTGGAGTAGGTGTGLTDTFGGGGAGGGANFSGAGGNGGNGGFPGGAGGGGGAGVGGNGGTGGTGAGGLVVVIVT